MVLDTIGIYLADLADDHHGWWNGSWMWLWGSLMIGLLVAIIGLSVWAISRGSRGPNDSNPPDRARQILAERYARGEIGRDEYFEKLADLE